METSNSVIIDELKVCYRANFDTLTPFMAVATGETLYYGEYRFYRTCNSRFRHFFTIMDMEGEIGQLKFGLYSEATNCATSYVFLKIQNMVLYDPERLARILTLPDEMGMEFNNYTQIDLAFDTRVNVPSLIKRLLRDKTITTIINGKAIKDRKKVQDGVCFEYSTSLDRLKHPSITFKQRKAVNNKNEGITVQAYDKKSEIDNHSGKQYILEYYGHPKQLYRLEVRLPYQELKDYCSH